METSKTRAIFVAAFALALLGGVAAGVLVARYLARPAEPTPTANASLSEELQLTPAQQDQMRQIWQGMRNTANDCYEQAQSIERARQDAYMKLLTEEQKKQYEKIHQDYQDRFTALTARRQDAFAQAVAQTKKLLNETQRHRYEAILSRRLGQGPLQGTNFEPATASSMKSSSVSSSESLASPD